MPESPNISKELVNSLERACRSLGFAEYMPHPMIGHFVRQVVPASFSENRFNLTQFYQWVRQEYSVPDHVFSRVFSRLSEDASEMGVEVILPDSYQPGFGETVKEWMKYELKEVAYAELKEELREEVRKELMRELRPDVYRELRSWMEGGETLDPRIDEKLLDAMEGGTLGAEQPGSDDLKGSVIVPGPSEEAVRQQLHERLLPDVEDDLYKELRPRLDRKIRDELEAELRPLIEQSLKESVREELRKELWSEVREEVKEDLRTVMSPVLESELKEELLGSRTVKEFNAGHGPEFGEPTFEMADDGKREGEAADSDSERGSGGRSGMEFCADDQLKIIRTVREKLIPQIRDQMISEISALARGLAEAEAERRREKLRSDPEYCLEKIQEFLFPDQPGLWNKVKPLIRPEEWSVIVRAREDDSMLDAETLERSRVVIREALKIKAEIEEEINSTPQRLTSSGGRERIRAIKKMLAGADEVIDFSLKSLSEVLGESDPEGAGGRS